MTTLILDCDPGIDDAAAILLALAAPQLELRAITAVAGNRGIERTFSNARNLCALAGRDDVPVFCGASASLGQGAMRTTLVHGENGLGGVEIPPSAAPCQTQNAASAIIDILAREPDDSVTLVGVGPLTNLALAARLDAAVFRRARSLVIMGGAVNVPGNVTPVAEFNFWVDPLAADIICQCGLDIELFGLDVTLQSGFTESWLAELAGSGGKAPQALAQMFGGYASRNRVIHDACAIAWLIEPGIFQARPAFLRVETGGQWCAGQSIGWTSRAAFTASKSETEGALDAEQSGDIPRARPTNANVYDRMDRDAFLALLLDRLQRLP